MITVLAFHALIAGAVAALGRRLGRHVMLIGALAPLSALVWMLASPELVVTTVRWMPSIGMDIALRLDAFSRLMVVLIGGIGTLIFVYAWGYFGDREGLGRFAAYLVGFAGSMFGVVVADNLLALYLFWELTSIASYLLIGFEDRSAGARSGALQALLVTAAGGLAMLGGIVILGQTAGTYSMSEIIASPPGGTVVGFGLGLVLLGAFTKSAQFPFHFWLPGAMAAPTPVSAYLHSATMVKAGIYLVARLAPAFVGIFGWWRPVVVTVGVVTMIVGGWRALTQHDLKLILAQGTVSQLGFIMVLVGLGVPGVAFAGMAMLLAHAVFKAALFMVAGIVDHQVKTRDIRRLSEVGRAMPATAAVAAVAVASMAGIPPLLGFVSKEAALESLVTRGNWWITAAIVAGSVLTAAYGLRFWFGAFARLGTEGAEDPLGREATPPATWFLMPPVILTAVTVVSGIVPALVDPAVGSAAEATLPSAGDSHLALWHGFGSPLLLSAVAVGLGWWLWRHPWRRLHRWTKRLPAAADVYGKTLNELNHFADRLTSVVQSGSLPIYLGVIVTTAIAAPSALMLRHWFMPERLLFAESPLQVVTAVLVMTAAIGTVLTRHRMGAVLFLGGVGYGVAVLFIIQGAPDLALTQLLIETLTLTLFVLVLRHFPSHFTDVEWRLRRMGRVIVSTLAGLGAGAFALWAAAGRTTAPLTGDYLVRAQPEAGGRNVVNVILTDFRGFDTMGEITVLTVAALGVVALVRAGRTRDEKAPSALETPREDKERSA